jgi:hypothetical protein
VVVIKRDNRTFFVRIFERDSNCGGEGCDIILEICEQGRPFMGYTYPLILNSKAEYKVNPRINAEDLCRAKHDKNSYLSFSSLRDNLLVEVKAN